MDSENNSLAFISEEEVRRLISPDQARRLIEEALLRGFDPSTDPARSHVTTSEGQILLMPSSLEHYVGVKVATVTPGNPSRGIPRIQALYLLMDGDTLTPRLLVSGVGLTSLRTPATSAVAADRLAPLTARNLLVFGTGPQAVEHVIAMQQIRSLENIWLIGRNPERTSYGLAALASQDVKAEAGCAENIAEADLIICATSAGEPVFDSSLVRDGACVVAIGSHEPDRRELEGQLIGRSHVIVEDGVTALREAGDIVLALAEGQASADSLHSLADLAAGHVQRAEDRPNVFKGTGMSWQDLAVASSLLRTGARLGQPAH